MKKYKVEYRVNPGGDWHLFASSDRYRSANERFEVICDSPFVVEARLVQAVTTEEVIRTYPQQLESIDEE